MGFHAGNWWSYIRYDEEQDRPEVSPALLRRVARYARPYWKGVALMLLTILGISLLSLVPPLLLRDLIDRALPERDVLRLNLLALGMVLVPLVNGLLGVAQRWATPSSPLTSGTRTMPSASRLSRSTSRSGRARSMRSRSRSGGTSESNEMPRMVSSIKATPFQ